jgi:hypothetical protein
MTAVAELSVSNLCWPDGPEAQIDAVETLVSNGVYAVDIAPGKAFPEMATVGPDGIDRDELVAFRRTLRPDPDFGTVPLRVAGLQSVTYGRTESIFSESAEERQALSDHVGGVIRLAEFVGARTVIYGGAGSRLTGSLDEERVYERAAGFFEPLGRLAADSGVILGLEPVSTQYTDGQPVFGRTAAEVAAFVDRLDGESTDLLNVMFVPDSFAMHDGGDNIAEVVVTAANQRILAPHAQVSERGMRPHVEEGPMQDTHDQLAIALMRSWQREAALCQQLGQPLPTLAIEMFPPAPDVRLDEVIDAARFSYSRILR